MANIYVIVSQEYIQESMWRQSIVGAFSTRESAVAYLEGEGYAQEGHSGNTWSWGWGTNAEIVEVPLDAAHGDLSIHEGIWSCVADVSW